MSDPKTALVTGGGSGIGRELCRLFARDGYRLVIVSLLESELVSVREELEAEYPQAEIITLQKDLSTVTAGEEVYAELVVRRGLQFDVLVNNAGFGLWDEHLKLPLPRLKAMLQLNMITLTTLCSLLGKGMAERGEGRILNIGSTTSFHPFPYIAAYSASKHYVVAFSEAFAEEMRPHGVQVSCVCPGTTDTQFLSTAGVQPSPKFGSVGYVTQKLAMSPVTVAAVAYAGLEAGSRKPIPGFSNKLHFLASRLLPGRGFAWLLRQLYLAKG